MKKKNKMQRLVWDFLELVVHAAPEELANLNVSIGARRLGTTPDTLCHAFKTHYICTPGKIMTLNKQGAFNKLIANRRAHGVKQALKILDIRSNSNFSEKYRKRFGCTPKETIKKHKKSLVAADQEKSKNNIYLNSESRSNSYR
ncbi:MAG: Helix-turn-helix protein [Acidobacteriota bacterium]|nr:Helix-turn-helix protein [Acidobacteriota bacterium]